MPQVFEITTGNIIYYSSLLVSIPNTGYDVINTPPTIDITNIENKYSGV